MSDADLPRRRLTFTHWREHRLVTTAAPAGAALGTWLVLVLLALPIRHRFGPHALSAGHQALPLALGVLLALGAGILLIRRPVTPVLAGVLLGAMAGWVSFSLLVILAGTPFPSGGMYGDCGRTVAAAQRFRLHWGSGDQFTFGKPSAYPPLWFFVWGRSAALFGKDAWQIGAVFQATALGFVVLVAGFVWRLLLRWPRALAATAATAGILIGPFHFDPCKGHEFSATMLVIPAVLFAHLLVVDVLAGRQRRLAAVGAGALLGLCLLLYQVVVLFALIGLLVLWIVTAIRAKRLAGLAVHMGCAVVAGFVVASWYVIPLIPAVLNNKYPRGPDPLMVFYSLNNRPGLFTSSLSITITAVLALVLVAMFIRSPLAQAIATIAVTCVVIQALALLNVVKGGESFYSYRTYYLLIVLAAASVVLFLDLPLWPRVVRDAVGAGPFAVRRAAVALGVGLMLFVVGQAWVSWHAPITPLEVAAADYPNTARNNQAARAYLTPTPNCGHVRGLPAAIDVASCFPAARVRDCVNQTYGAGALPIMISYDERLAGFYGYYYYLGATGMAGEPFDSRLQRIAYLRSLPSATSAADLLERVRHTPFGPIHGFVLAEQRDGGYRWVAQVYHGKIVVNFRPDLFDDPAWAMCQSNKTIILLDRSAKPTHR